MKKSRLRKYKISKVAYFTAATIASLYLVSCHNKAETVRHYLPSCCNYVSTGFCLNDIEVARIERSSVKDFTLTSLYNENGEFMFSIYEGEHPNYNLEDISESITQDGLTILKLNENEEQTLIKVLDGNHPTYIHLQNFSKKYEYTIDPKDSNRWFFFRSEPEYNQSPECSYDLSRYKN
ncbi:MAG: hypothetical protein ABJN69_11760 [Hellea sp.]